MNLRISSALIAFCVPAGAQSPAVPPVVEHTAESPARAELEADLVQHQVQGTVRSHRQGSTLAVIAHEEIPDYMEAMTMPLVVRKAEELKDVRAGDRIRFRLNVTDDDCWIDKVEIIGRADAASATPAPASEEPPRALRPGSVFPDFFLTDHLGKPQSLANYRGHAFALTFIYTNCPLPTFCPRINRQYQEVQKLIAAGKPAGAQLLSVTIDPARDTVEHLAGFAASWQADPAVWRFATGALKDITGLALRSGLSFWDEKGLIQHNLRTIVVDAGGKVHQVFQDSAWTAAELAASLASASRKATALGNK